MHRVRYFLALCETLNFARAAETCNVSQPALTRAVRKLEEELGGLLLRREHLLTHLTDFGRLVRPHLEQMTFSIGPSQWSTTRQFGTVVTALVRGIEEATTLTIGGHQHAPTYDIPTPMATGLKIRTQSKPAEASITGCRKLRQSSLPDLPSALLLACEHHANSVDKHCQPTAEPVNFVRRCCRTRDSRDLNVPGVILNRAAVPA